MSASTVIEGIGYAVARGADAINMSFGGTDLLPDEDEENAISEALESNPKLVIVASAGNESYPKAAFPSATRGVVAVGSTNLEGNRSNYSNYGSGLDVVAPGGDYSKYRPPLAIGGILTTGGTWVDGFWEGIPQPNLRWAEVLDPKGSYWWVQGTSFSSPAVAGVIALMKGEDPNRRLSRDRLISILKDTASYKGLAVSELDKQLYRQLVVQGKQFPNVSASKFFFGNGLVDADAAVSKVKHSN